MDPLAKLLVTSVWKYEDYTTLDCNILQGTVFSDDKVKVYRKYIVNPDTKETSISLISDVKIIDIISRSDKCCKISVPNGDEIKVLDYIEISDRFDSKNVSMFKAKTVNHFSK